MSIKNLDNCFLIDYWDIESIIENEFGLPHHTHFLSNFNNYSDSVSILAYRDDYRNDMILLNSMLIREYTEEELQDDEIWNTVNAYINGYDDDYNWSDEEIETLLCLACTNGKIESGEYYIRISW